MRLLLRYLKNYKGVIGLTLAALLIDDVGTLLVPTMLANMINSGIATGDMDAILRGGAVMLAVSVVASSAAIAALYLGARLAADVCRDIRCAIYESSLAFSASDFERFGTGSMITRSLGDINVVQQAIVNTIMLVLPVPILCIAGIVLAWRIDAQMGLLLAVVVVVMLGIAAAVMRRTAPIFMRLQGFIDRMNVVLRESIIGVRVVRAFGRERQEEKRLDQVFSEYANGAIKVNLLFAALDCSCFFLMNIVEVAVLWLGGDRVGAHAMQIASISAVLEYAMLILLFIMMAQMVILTLPRAQACLARAAEVIDLVPEIVDPVTPAGTVPGEGAPVAATEDGDALATGASDAVTAGMTPACVTGEAAPLGGTGVAGANALVAASAGTASEAVPVAAFEHATFRFSDASEDTLSDISFACRRGSTTAIIGSTGSGKSTVAKLLLRLHDVSDGHVRFGGIDVRDMTQAQLRSCIAYVPQKAWLFSGTVESNLRYGKEDATEAEMLHALEVAQSTFVLDLPEGLQAPVSQGGTNFSGGQRQRLAIARALMRKADLYIFDDSFSALDFRTDAALRAALAEETRDAAVLIIAQRVSTILHADTIVVLKDGHIMGTGTHEELMASCEVYRDIAKSQMIGGE